MEDKRPQKLKVAFHSQVLNLLKEKEELEERIKVMITQNDWRDQQIKSPKSAHATAMNSMKDVLETVLILDCAP